MKITSTEKRALQYIDNTGGCAQVKHFIEDHEPIGNILWYSLTSKGLADIKKGYVVLTMEGANLLKENDNDRR